MTILGEVAGTTVRTAGPSDNAALLRLMAEVPTPGTPSIAQERRPDFFALPRLHGGTATTYVAEDAGGAVVACGTLVARDGFLGGAPRRVGHIGDLRVRPSHRGARLLPAMGRLALEHARSGQGVEVCSAASLASNRRFARAVAAASPRRAAQPPGRRVGGYAMLSIVVPPPAHGASVRVRPAEPGDLSAVAGLLQRGQVERPFGYDLAEPRLRERLRTWPGLQASDVLLAFRGADLVGCAAPWDPSPVRQTRIASWGWAHGWRAVQDLRRRRHRLAPLPSSGGLLRLAYLTHLEHRGDPAVFAALAGAAWEWSQERGLHGVAAQAPLGWDPRIRAVRTEVDVHAVALPEVRLAVGSSGHPGLEMALA